MSQIVGQVGRIVAKVRQSFLLCATFVFISVLFVSSQNAMATTFNDPLVDAADIGDVGLVQKLLKNGHLPDSKGDFGTAALMRAAFRGNTDIIQILAESGAFVNAADVGGETALHLAAKNGHEDAVKALLYYGAYIDVPDKEQWTPLMRATLARQPEIVKDLIDKGADITAVNSLNESVLVHAAIAGVPDIASIIFGSPKANKITKEQGDKALSLAKRKNHDKVEKVISAFVNDKNNAPENKLAQNDKNTDALKENQTDFKDSKYKLDLSEKPVEKVNEEKKISDNFKPAEPVLPPSLTDNKKLAAPEKPSDTYIPQKPIEHLKSAEQIKPIEFAKPPVQETPVEQTKLIALDKPQMQAKTKTLAEQPEQIAKVSDNFPLKTELPKNSLTSVAGSFFIQIGTFNDKQSAQDAWTKALAKNADVLGKLSQTIVEANSSGAKKDAEYRLRAGVMGNKADADNNCKTLRERNLECYVIESTSPLVNVAEAKTAPLGGKLPADTKQDVLQDKEINKIKQDAIGGNYPKLVPDIANSEAPLDIAPKPSLMNPAPAKQSLPINNANITPVDDLPWLTAPVGEMAPEQKSVAENTQPEDLSGRQVKDAPIYPPTNVNVTTLTPEGKDLSNKSFASNNSQSYGGAGLDSNDDNFAKHKDEIRNEIQERTRAEYFSKQGITPPQRTKKEYDDFYKQIKKTRKDSSVSEAVMVPDETYFAGSEQGSNSFENSSNWLNIYNLPDENFANDYGIRMFKSDESLGNLQLIVNKPDNASTVTMRVGPIDASKAGALCNNVRAGGFGCSVVGESGSSANKAIAKRSNISKVETQEENPFAATSTNISDSAGSWINLGTFPSNSEAEYYWMFVKESNGDILNALQSKMMQNKEKADKSVKLMVGPFNAKQRASQLCNIMRYRNVACLVVD